MAMLVRAWNTVVMRTIQILFQPKRFQGGTILATVLRKILVKFWHLTQMFLCPCLKNLHEAELKSFGLILLAEIL